MERFLRIKRFLGEEKFLFLQQKRVVIVGLGAVGGYALEALARSGIENFLVFDFDIVKKSNINRQLLALESTLDKPKVELAIARVKDINPHCAIEGKKLFIHKESLEKISLYRPDLVIDAIDSVTPKTEMLAYCYEKKIPVISSMGAALRSDPSRIKTGDLFDTEFCPLARVIRTKLKKKNVGRGITVVYSTELIVNSAPESYDDTGEEEYFVRGRKRRVLGSLPTLTGIFGLTVANTALFTLLSQFDSGKR